MIYINHQEKLNQISFNKDNFYVVVDFDRTLTSPSSASTWSVLADAGLLGSTYIKKRKALYKIYRPIEIDVNRTEKEKSESMKKWWQAHLDLLKEYHLKDIDIETAIQKDILHFRKGAKTFLEKMYALDIPVLIISAGIGNVIQAFLRKEHKDYANIKIMSNFIDFDEAGYIKKFKNEMIHSVNKNIIKLDKILKKEIEQRPYILLLGDGIDDLKMISEKQRKTAITVGFLDENIKENLKVFNQNYDIVLTNHGSFYDVNKVLKLYK